MLYHENFDVIVVGGGHAGTEAALASARTGQKNSVTDAQYRYAGSNVMQPCHRRYR